MCAFTTSIALAVLAIEPPVVILRPIIPDSPPARIERDGPLATIVIDHPPLNLFGAELTSSIASAIEEVEKTDARALLIRAEGRVFTGGADVHGFEGLNHDRGEELLGGR
jgi:enoyl-CoA hydratase/carnithine racemase